MNDQSDKVEPLIGKTAAAILIKFALAAFFVLGLGVALIASFTYEPPSNQTTAAITEPSAPVSFFKDVSKPIVIDCGGAKSQLSFEKTPENGVVFLITVSRGDQTIKTELNSNDYVGIHCQRTKSGRELLLYGGECGGSSCGGFDVGIIDPVSLQVLLEPASWTSERSKALMALLGDGVEEFSNQVTFNDVEDALYNYHDVKSALLDGQNSVGKNIHLNATYRELGMSGGLPTMRVDVDTDTSLNYWNVFFSDRLRSNVNDLKAGQRLAITCKILALNGYSPNCELIEWQEVM